MVYQEIEYKGITELYVCDIRSSEEAVERKGGHSSIFFKIILAQQSIRRTNSKGKKTAKRVPRSLLIRRVAVRLCWIQVGRMKTLFLSRIRISSIFVTLSFNTN